MSNIFDIPPALAYKKEKSGEKHATTPLLLGNLTEICRPSGPLGLCDAGRPKSHNWYRFLAIYNSWSGRRRFRLVFGCARSSR